MTRRLPLVYSIRHLTYLLGLLCLTIVSQGETRRTLKNSLPLAGQGIMLGELSDSRVHAQVRLTKSNTLVDGDVAGIKGVVQFVLRERTNRLRPNKDAAVILEAMAIAENDFIARVTFTKLKPNTPYEIRTLIGTTATSLHKGPLAQFITHPGAASDEPVHFVVVTGMNYGKFHGDNRIDGKVHLEHNNTALPEPYAGRDKHLGYPALAAITRLQPDFFIGTGDNVYYDTPKDPRAQTITEMRQKWHEQFVQPRYRDLFAKTPTYWEVDDHDYRIDDGDNSGDHLPSPETAVRVMYEQLPYAGAGDRETKTYRTVRVSKDLQLWFVEGRIYRSDNALEDGPTKSIWGTEQKAWLKKTLLASDATFKVMISATPMVGPDDKRKFDNHTNFGGFRQERDEFFKFLVDNKLADNNFYLVCGDRHWQYHAEHPSGVQEFSTGALVDANSRPGRKAGDPLSTDPDGLIKQHYLQDPPSGGFLHVAVVPQTKHRSAIIAFMHRNEHGKLLNLQTNQGK